MAYWGRDPAYLAEAERLMSLEPDDLARDEAWIAEHEGMIAGYYRVAVSTEVALIEELFVEPEWIGQGVGRELFEHAKTRARESGARRLEWETDRNAIGFYRAMVGMEIGTTPLGIRGDEPLTRMTLELDTLEREALAGVRDRER